MQCAHEPETRKEVHGASRRSIGRIERGNGVTYYRRHDCVPPDLLSYRNVVARWLGSGRIAFADAVANATRPNGAYRLFFLGFLNSWRLLLAGCVMHARGAFRMRFSRVAWLIGSVKLVSAHAHANANAPGSEVGERLSKMNGGLRQRWRAGRSRTCGSNDANMRR